MSAAKCSGVIGTLIVPPDGVLGLGVADDELVLGRAAGVLAGLDDQRAVLGEQALAAADRLLDQRRGAEVPVISWRCVSMPWCGQSE